MVHLFNCLFPFWGGCEHVVRHTSTVLSDCSLRKFNPVLKAYFKAHPGVCR
jgi:hypothetical protein